MTDDVRAALKRMLSFVERGWAQQWTAYAGNARVLPYAENADRWSLDGAIIAAVPPRDMAVDGDGPIDKDVVHGRMVLREAVGDRLRAVLPAGMRVDAWNDAPKRTQAEVVALAKLALGRGE